MKKLKPILTLVFITPFLTELLTNNVSLAVFFRPQVFLSLLVIYGLAVLVIRELAVRWNLGLPGILILGLAYGIYNEGIIAKTLLMTKTVPIAESYGHYPLFFGINLAFALMILSWHAFHAVLFPILIVHFFNKEKNKNPWLNKFWLVMTSMIVMSIGALSYFETDWPKQYFFIFTTAIIFLAIASRISAKTQIIELKRPEKILPPVIYGLLFMAFYFWGMHILGSEKIPLVFLCTYAFLILLIFYRILRKKQWLTLESLLLFGLGSYLLHSFLAIIRGLKTGALDIAIVGAVLAIIFLTFIFKIKRQKAI